MTDALYPRTDKQQPHLSPDQPSSLSPKAQITSHRTVLISHQFDPNIVIFVEAVAVCSGVDDRVAGVIEP